MYLIQVAQNFWKVSA